MRNLKILANLTKVINIYLSSRSDWRGYRSLSNDISPLANVLDVGELGVHDAKSHQIGNSGKLDNLDSYLRTGFCQF